MGNYVIGQPSTGPGIRRFQYTTDQNINPLTYNDIDQNQQDIGGCRGSCSQVHNAGEIWASTLWDMYWELVDRDGFNTSLYQGTQGGNNLALSLVTEGMKFTPASPTMLDARDGILSADQALFGLTPGYRGK